MGADARNHPWQWSDGSTQFYRAVTETADTDGMGEELCTCWYTADDVLYDAPCESFNGQNRHFICGFEE